MVDLTALRNEIQNDPTALGYSAHIAAKRNAEIADILNLPRANVTVRRSDISATDLVHAIEVADYTALGGNPTAAQLSTERRYLAWLSLISAVQTIRLLNDDGTNTPVVNNLQAMFPAGSGTRNRILALATRQGSRAEQLFGTGTRITATDVSEALAAGG